MSAEQQNEIVADWILNNCSEEIGNEGAGDVAVRMLAKYRAALVGILDDLGVPGEGYPAPVAYAYELAKNALEPDPKLHDFDDETVEESDEMQLRCYHIARWEILDDDSDMIILSCTEHLNVMVSDITVSIKAYANAGIIKNRCGYRTPCTK